jgi:hypothetical protein
VEGAARLPRYRPFLKPFAGLVPTCAGQARHCVFKEKNITVWTNLALGLTIKGLGAIINEPKCTCGRRRVETKSNYLHSVPGRLRIRSAAVKRNEAGAHQARRLLEGVSGVNSVATNTLTGSITVCYDTRLLDSSTLLAKLREQGYVNLENANGTPAAPPPTARAANAMASYVVEKAVEHSLYAMISALL